LKTISRLHFITQETLDFTHVDSANKALKGGAKWIQLRVKDKSKDEIYELAKTLKNTCKEHKATLILNDYLEIVKDLDLDGVHLGMTDASTLNARQLLGKNKIIGGTANTFEHILFHVNNQVDYIGFGPYRFTDTKTNLSPILGFGGFKLLQENIAKTKIKTPIIAIGGIQIEDIKDIYELGIHGVALASLINLDENPIRKTTEILDLINSEYNA
jgi:thiamine-phosphate pyrophosphorylase